MSDIFLSYESSDRIPAQQLAEALQARGWTVWWDRKIPPGRTFEEVITEAIEDARCMVVLWSVTSVKSDWVRDEAQEGRSRGILVPASLDGHKAPMGFRQLHSADLSQWGGDDQCAQFGALCAEIQSRIPPGTTEADSGPEPELQPVQDNFDPGSESEHEPSTPTRNDLQTSFWTYVPLKLKDERFRLSAWVFAWLAGLIFVVVFGAFRMILHQQSADIIDGLELVRERGVGAIRETKDG